MTKKVKFLLTTSWILISRSYDAYCTSLHTPDLSKESNPLVSVLGMGWTPLLITIGVLTILAIYAYYVSVFKPKDLMPTERGYTFGSFATYVYLGYKANLFEVFYKMPKDISRFIHYMGHTLSRCLVFAGVVSTIMWLLINHVDAYRPLHNAPLIYGILLTGCFAILYNWNRQMYKIYWATVNA